MEYRPVAYTTSQDAIGRPADVNGAPALSDLKSLNKVILFLAGLSVVSLGIL